VVIHPDPDQLVAYADGDGTSVDLGAVGEHVRQCTACGAEVRALGAVRDVVRDAANRDRPPAPQSDWGTLAAAIHRRERTRAALRWVTGLAAASIVGAALLTGTRRSGPTEPEAAVSQTRAIPRVDTTSDSAATALWRAVVAGRDRLSVNELRTMGELVVPIDGAIRQTRDALRRDPTDPFLLAHLAELQRKRVSALNDFVDRIRSRG
jgi:anti-sigma factor RsiW